MSRPETHPRGMIVNLYLKLEDSKYEKTRDKNVGKIGRKIAEKSFFGGPRKEKRLENSTARKIGRKSALSAIFRRKIGTGRKIGCGRHALGGALAAGKVGEKSARSPIYRR